MRREKAVKESTKAQLFVVGLRAYSKARGLSVYAFEMEFHIPRQTISGWLSETRRPQRRLVEKIARQLHVPAARLCSGEPWPLPDECEVTERKARELALAVLDDAALTHDHLEQTLKWQEARRILATRATAGNWTGRDGQQTVSTIATDGGVLWYEQRPDARTVQRTRVRDDGTLDPERKRR
jgi:transcriptional regulator with XRE-family HTH domain